MDSRMNDFEDILEPRRTEICHVRWTSKELKTIVPYKQVHRLTPKQLKQAVLRSNKLQGIIEKISKEKGMPKAAVEEQVKLILDEIGFNKDLFTIRANGYVITKICLKVFSGIYVNRKSILSLRSQMGKTPVIYVPSHRSYGDFILMSYIFFFYDIEIPAIAAGMDFHGMWGMGKMLRDTGAFFMRRSYNDDPLYWDTFRQYVYQLVTKSEIGIEFFIEGTRSRTNKSLVPKYGLLSMILRAYFNAEVPDILFCPINITYDRILEETLFAFELLGVPKPKESTSGFFKSLSILSENYGNYYINFGDPISAREFFGDKIERCANKIGPTFIRSLTDKEKQLTTDLALSIISTQQKLCVVTIFNLVALVSSSHFTRRETMPLSKLLIEIESWIPVVEALGGLVEKRLIEENDIMKSLATHKNLIYIDEDKNLILRANNVAVDKSNFQKLKGHDLSSETMTLAIPYVMLQLYINPLMHYLVNSSFVTNILTSIIFHGSEIFRDVIFERFKFLRLLFSKEFVYTDPRDTMVFEETLRFMESQNMINIYDNSIRVGTNEKLINFFVSIIQPFMLCYHFTLSVLTQIVDGVSEEKVLFASVQAKIESLLHDSDLFIHPYSLNLDSISNCLQSLVSLGVLRKTKRDNGFAYIIDKGQLYDLCENFAQTCVLPEEVQLKHGTRHIKNKL